MHVVWKRPDGFHGAEPSDFHTVEVGSRAKIWLHRKDHSHFPFRIAGGWQESEATIRLNNMINLVDKDEKAWVDCLMRIYDHSMKHEAAKFLKEMATWIDDLRNHLKGDTWEVDIMAQVLEEVKVRIQAVSPAFLARTQG